MAQKKHIALLAGGASDEREVSFISAKSVEEGLKEIGYKVSVIDPIENIIEKLQETKPEIVFNCLHGTYGEDGIICGVLEMLKIPYTHSGVTASAIAMNKTLTKKIAQSCEIKTPKSLNITKDKLLSIFSQGKDPMPMPYVIKPEQQGSAVGVYIIKEASDMRPTEKDLKFQDIIVEKYIAGQELSVPVFRDKSIGVIEIKPKKGFYDYSAKYTAGLTEYVIPAQIPDSIYQEAMNFAEVMHNTLGCRTLSRSDLIYNPSNQGLYFLEINTHPGFTKLSLLPQAALKNGISFSEILEQLIKDAKCIAED